MIKSSIASSETYPSMSSLNRSRMSCCRRTTLDRIARPPCRSDRRKSCPYSWLSPSNSLGKLARPQRGHAQPGPPQRVGRLGQAGGARSAVARERGPGGLDDAEHGAVVGPLALDLGSRGGVPPVRPLREPPAPWRARRRSFWGAVRRRFLSACTPSTSRLVTTAANWPDRIAPKLECRLDGGELARGADRAATRREGLALLA